MNITAIPHHKLTQFDIYNVAEEAPGAYALFNGDKKLLYLTWTDSLAKLLTKHLAVNERNPELRGKAKEFAVYECAIENEFIVLHDDIIDQLGELPILTTGIPEGSKYSGGGKAETEHRIDALIAKAQTEFKADNIEEAYRLMKTGEAAGNGVTDYHIFMGQLMAVKGFNDAIAHYEKAAEADPVSPQGIKAAALAERCQDLVVGFKKL